MKTKTFILIISIILFIGSLIVLISLPKLPNPEDYCKKAINGSNLLFISSDFSKGFLCTYSVNNITCINQNLCENSLSEKSYYLSDGLKEEYISEREKRATPLFL